MSAWSGIVGGGLALVLAFAMASQPVWTWQHNSTGQTDKWSYSVFGATNVTQNGTANATAVVYPYASLPNQPNLSAVFLAFQRWYFLAVLGALAAIGLSVANLLRRLKGLYAGIALLAACATILFGTLNLVLEIPHAAADLPVIGGQPILQFEGQILSSGSGPNPIVAFGPGLGWYMALGLGLVLGFGASEMWSVPIPKPKGSRTAERAVASKAIANPPPPPVEVAPTPEEPAIEEVFVIASNGLLIKHMSRSLMSDKDRDVVGGMISVLSNFVREAFTERDAGEVQEVTLGDHRFIIANDRGVVAAALVSRGEVEDVKHRLFHLLACLHDRYGERLVNWQGESLPGIEDEVGVLWEPFFVPPPPLD